MLGSIGRARGGEGVGVASWFHSIRSMSAGAAEDWRVADVHCHCHLSSLTIQLNEHSTSNRHTLNYIAGRRLHIDDSLDSSPFQLPVFPNWTPPTRLVSSIDPDLALSEQQRSETTSHGVTAAPTSPPSLH